MQPTDVMLPEVSIGQLMECTVVRLWPVYAQKFHVPTQVWEIFTKVVGAGEPIGGMRKVELKGIEVRHEPHLPHNLIIVDMSDGTRLPMNVDYDPS